MKHIYFSTRLLLSCRDRLKSLPGQFLAELQGISWPENRGAAEAYIFSTSPPGK